MSPMSFVPVAGPVDDQQRCSASSVVSSCAFPSLKDDGLGQNLLIPPCPLQQSCPETFRFSFAPRSVVRRVRVVFRCVLCQKSFSPHHRSLSRVVEEQLLLRGFDYADKKKRCARWSSAMVDSASRTWSWCQRDCVHFLISPTLLNCSTMVDVRSLSFSPLSDMLAGGGAEDTHGLMTHKTRGSEMKVVIWRVSPDKTQFNQTFAVLLGHHPLTFLLLGAKTCRSPSG